MQKIIIFLIRLNVFVFSYFLYLVNLIFIFLNLKNLSKKFFTYSAYFCSLSLGISFKLNKRIKSKLLEKGIHIANHDNPLDIFVAQYVFKMPTITTVDQHLKKFLPFFQLSLNNFGHKSFNHLNLNDRRSAYYFLKKICNNKKNFLIFPSGSIYTPIDKRFSKSISKLSISYNLNVIAWKIYYRSNSKKQNEYNRDIFKFIMRRFFSEDIEFNIKQVKIFCPSDFLNEKEYHDKIRSFYIN